MKANHNGIDGMIMKKDVVSNGSKILKWKQITTIGTNGKEISGCF